LRRRKRVAERDDGYTSVPRNNSELSNSITYYNPHYRRGHNAESNTYAIPYAHNQFTTFHPSASISARGDNIRRKFDEYE
jgi:hypothetical protein